MEGSAPGLYGGTRNVASCDVEKQIRFLRADAARTKAFASVLDIATSSVPAYLRSLTPVQLRMDTRVTKHGYKNGAATSYQAVLQAGTAVLVDDRGVPRVRCACGNPLRPPVTQKGTPRPRGDTWPAYRPSDVVVVAPAPKAVKEFMVYDPESGEWFARRPGDTGARDKKTAPPPGREPSPSPDTTGQTTDETPPEESPPKESPASEPATPESPAPESPASEITTLPPPPPGSPDSQ